MDAQESQVPPPLQLSDGGLRWRREGRELRIERRASPRALFFPLLALGAVVTIGTLAFRDGDAVVGGVMVFGSFLAAVMVWIRIVQRAHIVIGPDGVRWQQSRPRGLYGHWSRDRVDGLRVYVHAKGRWLEPRQGHVDLRVDGGWVQLVFGGRLGRAERLAEEIALATGFSPDRAEAEF